MKILINAFSAKRGGILTYSTNLLRSLTARGIKAVAAVSPEFELPDGVEGLRIPIADRSPVYRLVWEQTIWPRIVRQIKPDVLFSSANFGLLRSPVPQLLLMREGGLFDPFYLRYVSPDQGLRVAMNRVLRRRLMLASIRAADRVMTPTRTMKDLLVRWTPESAGKIAVNSYGTLEDTFASPGTRRAWREDGVLRILYVSVYYPHKSPGDVCRLVELLERRGIRAHATITMTLEEVGRSPGSALDLIAMERLWRAGKLTLGRQPYGALPQVYDSHDIFVFPAVAETFGHPLAEALSSAIPVIAADTPVAREVCGDQALYVRPFHIGSYADAVMALDADPERRRRLVDGGRDRVLTTLLWQGHIDRLVDLMEETRRA